MNRNLFLERIAKMERRTIKMTTFVVILSILSVILEFAVYYFTDMVWPMTALTVLVSLILSHIFLETSLNYETGLLFSVLSMVLSTICTALIYFNQTGGLFVYRNHIHLTIYLHWFVPMVYHIFRCLFDKGPRFVSFNFYFYRASLIFAVYYVCNLIYHTMIDPIILPYAFSTGNNSFIPFFSTAAHIEDFIYMGTGVGELLIYIAKLFVLFMPMGFYISLILREHDVKSAPIIKIAVCIFIPLIFEAISFFQGNAINIDSYLYRFLGIFLGIVLLKVLNVISLHLTGEEFLYERNLYSFFLNY